MPEITDTLRGLTLARVRALSERIAVLERERLDALAFFLEGQGHDPNALEITAIDVASGAFTARTKEDADAAA